MTGHVVVSSLLGGCVSSEKKVWLEGGIVTIAGQILTDQVAEALVASRTVCWVWRTRRDINYMESNNDNCNNYHNKNVNIK